MTLTGLEAGLLVTTIEFALIACAIAYYALRRGRQATRQQVADVAGLVNRVDGSAETRREALAAVITETYRFDSEETERVVTDFIERERAFYNAMIGVHLGRGGKSLEDVPAELTKVVAPWLRLTPKDMIPADTVTALENANSVLNQELVITKRVLDELMEEYNAAFHKERSRGATAEPEADDGSHDLLSIDDGDAPLAAHATAAPRSSTAEVAAHEAPASTAPSAPASGAVSSARNNIATDDFEDVGEIIALDLDTDETLATTEMAEGLTPNDLDALMENLEFEEERRTAVA
ncbi:MAG: hypothetical protein AB7V59_18570 [Gammaproteobacteria bacterium]